MSGEQILLLELPNDLVFQWVMADLMRLIWLVGKNTKEIFLVVSLGLLKMLKEIKHCVWPYKQESSISNVNVRLLIFVQHKHY